MFAAALMSIHGAVRRMGQTLSTRSIGLCTAVLLVLAGGIPQPLVAQTTPTEPSVSTMDMYTTAKAEFSAEEYYQRGHDALSANDKARALDAFRAACQMDNAKSCFNVGLLTETLHPAKAGDIDALEQIFKPYAKACMLGFQRACATEAQLYQSDKYGVKNLPKAEAMLSKACFEGEMSGCEDLAELHYTGVTAVPSFDLAATLFKKSCDAEGRALSCFNYGLMREKGQGTPKNTAMALEYYRLGCRKGADVACINLAIHYADRKETIIAKGLFRQSCDRGALVACANLGELLRNSNHDHPDNAAAVQIFRKACDKNDGKSCRALGQMAQEGIKVAGSMSGAIRHFEKGCQLQYGQSCYNAGFTHWIGYHIPKNPQTALSWFAKGCSLKSASSCAGASLAALAFKKGDPRGGEAVARQWFDAAYALDPDNDLVTSLKDWYDRDADKKSAPPTMAPTGE